jgi:hypothetical protein
VAVPTFDTAYFPLVISTLPPVVTEETLAALMDGQREVFARRERFAHLGDLRALSGLPNARIRQRLAQWTKEIERDSARYNVGSALVVPNALVRGGLTALSWLHQPPSPQYVGATVPECYAWCIAKLEAASVPIPQSTLAYGAHLRREIG